ncbi:uncharacterized protein LOC141674285 [Apium graveolens]|uniref:uncharacterized protein LOC141674285 n=1 Tax=Apium graveolens TaxID=4045 RepID=UPI003D7A46C2
MTLKDAIIDNDIIAGTLLVNSSNACVLIDSGATRSFISENFVNKFGLELTSLEEDMMINCRLKRVSLKSLDNKKVILRGEKQTRKFLTMLQARRMLRQGCLAYLTHVIDTLKSTPRLEEIPVVKEFEDVFPEDQPGLPPDREIEFTIDLTPETTPVSKTPY